MTANKAIKPNYAYLEEWESYSSNLITEYRQSTEEGLDLSAYEEVFRSVARLPKDETRERLADALFDAVLNAPPREGYKYTEPSDLDGIRKLRRSAPRPAAVDTDGLEDKILGAWTGRICGCLLGKTVEGIKLGELVPFLTETGNYPMRRYILRGDLNDGILERYGFRFADRCYADEVDGMPVDDDTNYLVLAQKIIEKYGRDFTPYDVSRVWLARQSKNAYCTAERVAFCNFVRGFLPPDSARYKNPYREWIGAQIRGDYYGYINPGDPETAAGMAFRDASVSHVKNGIYGEMFVSAMIAVAACTDDTEKIISGGLDQIPATSRLYEAVSGVLSEYGKGVPEREFFAAFRARYDDRDIHDWCHVISNAEIVAASLLYGGGDFGRSICIAVENGFDTDCNGATVGSVLGMAKGSGAIDARWTRPVNGTLFTSVLGAEKVRISDAVKRTVEHIRL